MILVIDHYPQSGQAMCDMLRYMGYIAVHKAPYEALAEANPRYHAAIVLNPGLIPAPEDYIKRLRVYLHASPIFAIKDQSMTEPEVYDAVYDARLSAARIIHRIDKYCMRNGKARPGLYGVEGLDISAWRVTAKHYDDEIKFTRTEKTLIRYLTVAYPNPADTNELTHHSFNPQKIPSDSNIRSHVSNINAKFRQYEEYPLIISMPGGYCIYTPEMCDNIKKLEEPEDVPTLYPIKSDKK